MLFQEHKIEHHILHVLSRQPEHGYRIAQAIKSRAQGLIDGQESMLYPVLYSQEHQGIIESYLQCDGDHTYRFYRLTDKGRGLAQKIHDAKQKKSHTATLIPEKGNA